MLCYIRRSVFTTGKNKRLRQSSPQKLRQVSRGSWDKNVLGHQITDCKVTAVPVLQGRVCLWVCILHPVQVCAGMRDPVGPVTVAGESDRPQRGLLPLVSSSWDWTWG